MRLFLALRVPPISYSHEKFRNFKTQLDAYKVEAKWSDLNLLYIPLAELGDHGRGSFLRIYDSLKSVSYEFVPFDVKLKGIWGFPKQESAELLWIDVQNTRELRKLHDYLADKLALPPEVLIKPHIPLVQLSSPIRATNLVSPFKNTEFGRVNIHEVLILEKLPGKGSVHLVGSHLLHGNDLSGVGLS